MNSDDCLTRFRNELNECITEIRQHNVDDPLNAAYDLFAQTCGDPAAIVGYYIHWYPNNPFEEWKSNIKHKKKTPLMRKVNKMFREVLDEEGD